MLGFVFFAINLFDGIIDTYNKKQLVFVTLITGPIVWFIAISYVILKLLAFPYNKILEKLK